MWFVHMTETVKITQANCEVEDWRNRIHLFGSHDSWCCSCNFLWRCHNHWESRNHSNWRSRCLNLAILVICIYIYIYIYVAGTFWYNASVRWLLYILLICWVRYIHIVFQMKGLSFQKQRCTYWSFWIKLLGGGWTRFSYDGITCQVFSILVFFYMFFQLFFRRESCPWPHAHRQRYHKQQNTSVNNTRWSLCSKLLQLYKHPVPIGNGIISKNINSSDILWTSYSRYVNSTWPHAQKQRIANSGAAYDTVAFGDGAK